MNRPSLRALVLLVIAFTSKPTHAFSLRRRTFRIPSFLTATGPNRGDARGATLLLENLSVYRGPAKIIDNISWRVEPKTKWALVGQNGAGKSTLLGAITAQLDSSEGTILIGNNERVGYLRQTAVAGDGERTVYEEATSGMVQVNAARKAMDAAAEAGDLEALEKATARFEALDGYKQEQEAGRVLKGLGFTNFDVQCKELSGGWQMRVSFARTLLERPSFLLLDEPSNHLDSAAKTWLANYLANYDGGAMILVTHDVEMLQSMDHIAEVIPGAGKLQLYKSCSYDQYLKLKEQRAAAAVAEYERNTEKAAKLQAFIDRFGASATKASAAQSRVKAIEKMEREGLLDLPAEAVIAEHFKPSLVLPEPPRAVGETLLSLENAEIGHDKSKVLVHGASMDIVKGMKLLVRGKNGAGKSTLLLALRGALPLLAGKRKENPTLRLGIFTQDLAQQLDPGARAVDIVTDYARGGDNGDITMSEQEARSALGRLGLQGEKALRTISDLSGGEKARVALAMFAVKPSNVLILDEPSNHLDIECSEALSMGIGQWGVDQGATVVISHDKKFCERIDFTHVATVANKRLTIEQRSIRDSDWFIDDLSGQEALSSSGSSSSMPGGEIRTATTAEVDPKLRKLAYNAPKRIVKLEDLIEKAEIDIASIDEEMLACGNDVGALVDLQKKKDVLQEKVDVYMAEWEELEEILARVTV